MLLALLFFSILIYFPNVVRADSSPIFLTYSVHNSFAEPIKILITNTLFQQNPKTCSFCLEVHRVTNDGSVLLLPESSISLHFQWNSFYVLEPEETLFRSHDLSYYYDLTQEGDYSVTMFNPQYLNIKPEEKNDNYHITTFEIEIGKEPRVYTRETSFRKKYFNWSNEKLKEIMDVKASNPTEHSYFTITSENKPSPPRVVEDQLKKFRHDDL